MQKIELHPSGIGQFFNCSYAWYRNNIYKPIRGVGSAAHIGTAIHKAGETYYNECINKSDWVNPLNSTYEDVSIETFRNRLKEDEPTDIKGLDIDSAINLIRGKQKDYLTKARELCSNKIPVAVEKHYDVKLNSSIDLHISGTIDIVNSDTIADIKTMGRKNPPRNYWLQQAIYSLLREREDEAEVKDLLIHRVLTTKDEIDCVSIINEMPVLEIDEVKNRSKNLLLSLVGTLEEFYKTGNEGLFRGNPTSLTCSQKYCPYWPECKYKGLK